jgi:cytochrome oxidase Cu insertion factor (SCO1/SenC/PrrC family)
VVAAELRQAEVDLAKVHLRPALVIVNADPERLSTISVRTTLRQGLTAALPGATFLTASLGRIQTVWKRYGVTVELDPTTHALAYTNVLYVIGPTGKLRDALTPFANESLSGRATLPKTEIDRFARGIAIAVQSVAR